MRPLGVTLGFLFCALLFAPLPARAESAPPASPLSDDTGLAVYFFAGHSAASTSALDASLSAGGYSAFSTDPGSGGLGMRGWSHGWMGGLELQLALADAYGADGRQVSLDTGQFMFQAGRILATRRHLRTYAMAGVGYGMNSLSSTGGIFPPRAVNGLGLLSGKEATSFALALQSLVGVDYLVPLGRSSRGFNGFLFGLRAGYNLQPSVSGWTLSNGSSSASSGPPVGLPRVADDGPFVHLVFGEIALGR